MKLRSGFVSNSSSSSFVCDFCGRTEGGYDVGLADFEMSECKAGHTFCDYEIVGETFEEWWEHRLRNWYRWKYLYAPFPSREKEYRKWYKYFKAK